MNIDRQTGMDLEEYISWLIKNMPEWVDIKALNILISHIFGHEAKTGSVTTIDEAVAKLRLFIVQYLTIVNIYEDISKAENVEKDSRAKIKDISIILEEMKPRIAKLAVMITKFKQQEETIQIDATKDIKWTVSELVLDCKRIKNDIEDIKIKINGSIQTLGTQKRKCRDEGIQIISIIAEVALLMIFPKRFAFKVIGRILFTGGVIFAGFYFTDYLITRKRLAELRDCLEVVNATENDFQKIYNSVEDARKFYRTIC